MIRQDVYTDASCRVQIARGSMLIIQSTLQNTFYFLHW